MSSSTLSIYMNTEPASRITRAATLLSSIFSLFFLLWLLPCNTAVWERSTSLLFFLLQALFIGYCVRGGYFFAKRCSLPSQLTSYFLLKAHQSISQAGHNIKLYPLSIHSETKMRTRCCIHKKGEIKLTICKKIKCLCFKRVLVTRNRFTIKSYTRPTEHQAEQTVWGQTVSQEEPLAWFILEQVM